MAKTIDVERFPGSGAQTYVVEGATLMCTLGGKPSNLKIPNSHNVYINSKSRANIGDHRGGENIMSFGPCARAVPPPPCIMATGSKWIGGKDDVLIDGELALLNTSVSICNCGGVISIIDDGQ